MTESPAFMESARELLVLTLVLVIYLLVGTSAYFLAMASETAMLLAPGIVLLLSCAALSASCPLRSFALYNGRGTSRIVLGAAALLVLLALLAPARQFGEPVSLGSILVVVAVVPLAEELFFRGFFFDHLWRNLGPVGAWLLSAVFFGGLHQGNGYVVSALVLGLLAGGAVLRTRSVAAAVAVHVLWNACAVMESVDPASRNRVTGVALAALALLYLYGRITRKGSDESPSTDVVSPGA